jgi:nucleoside-diphosphate-sugar epimerase
LRELVGEDNMCRIVVTGGSGFIGTNLIEALLTRGKDDVLNLDISQPKEAEQYKLWTKCDLLDAQSLLDILSRYEPAHIIHLAGRTDMEGKTEADYAANHLGTGNLVAAIQHLPTVERAIFTSSQFVVGPGALPSSDVEFRPHTIYGQSKVKSEQVIRNADLSCVWTIVRPTNVWGKWHPRYPKEFWRVLKQGRYIQPSGKGVLRCYAYVGTVVQQLCAILEAPPRAVNREVFYVGDAPIDLWDWTNAFSMELLGRPVRVVPRPVVRSIARAGDAVIALGGKFPIFSSRYRSMTESYVTPMQKTFDLFGMPSVELAEGVKETVTWLRSQSDFWL